MGKKIKGVKGIVFGLFVIMIFIIMILGLVEKVRAQESDSKIYWDETQQAPTLDKTNKDTGKENPVANEQQIREFPDFGIENYDKASPDQQSWTISEEYGVDVKDTSGSTLDNNILTMENGVKIDLANTEAGTNFEMSGDSVKMTSPDGKSNLLTNVDGETLSNSLDEVNNNLGSACGCGITSSVISIDSMSGNAIAPVTGFAIGGCAGGSCAGGGETESESAPSGGAGGGSLTSGADALIQAFLGVWSSLSGILSSIGQAVKDGAAKSGGSSSLTSTGSDLTASYNNGGGVGLNDNKASVGTTGTAGTSTATMGSGSSSTTTTGKAVSDSNTVSSQSRDGRTAIMEQEDLTKPGKTIIKNYNTLGLKEMESENTKMHLFTKEGSESKRLVTLHMPEQKTSIINNPNGGTPKLSDKARESDMSGTGSGVTGNAVSGDAIADISSEGQYVNIEGYDMKIGGEKMDIKIYKPFNDIIAKGSLLVVRDADSRFEFNGNRMYYNRIPPQNLHFMNRIANGLDSSNDFSLFPGGENGNYLIDGKEIATVGDEVVEHPSLKGIYIAKEREEMFKKAVGMK